VCRGVGRAMRAGVFHEIREEPVAARPPWLLQASTPPWLTGPTTLQPSSQRYRSAGQWTGVELKTSQ
jgi:hypothetical protein